MSKKKNKQNQKQNPYHVDKFATIPAWFKIEFLKFWLAGASFYIIVFGLPQAFDYLDRLVMLAIVLGIGLEYLVQLVIRWMNTDKQPTDFYLVHNIKRNSVYSLFASLGYAIVMVVLYHLLLNLWLNLGLLTIGDLISESTLDPFSFAIVYLVFDTAWIYLRQWFKNRKHDKQESQKDEISK